MSSKNNIDRLYSYTMTYDTGFAPNPFFGICTLACCKPTLRTAIAQYFKKKTDLLNKKVNISSLNIWITGIAGKGLAEKSKHNEGDIIYLMQVTNIMSFEKYSKDPKYRCKIPNPAYFSAKRKNYGAENTSYENCGDNIYVFSHHHDIQRRPSFHNKCSHDNCNHEENDLSSPYILISDHYIYFGETTIFPNDFHAKGNRGYSVNYSDIERKAFLNFVNTLDFTKKIQGKPTECADAFDIENGTNIAEKTIV